MLYLHYLFDFVVKFQCKFFKKARLVRARTRQLVKVSGRPVLKLVIILRVLTKTRRSETTSAGLKYMLMKKALFAFCILKAHNPISFKNFVFWDHPYKKQQFDILAMHSSKIRIVRARTSLVIYYAYYE